MADVIRVDYDALAQIADRFGQQSEAISGMMGVVRGVMEPLEGGGWVGRGSDAFFAEMNRDILPAVQRLTDALAQARAVTNQIHNLMQQADEEASAGFRSGAAVGGSSMLSGVRAAGMSAAFASIAAALGKPIPLGGIGGVGGAWGGGFNPSGIGGALDGIIRSGFGGLGGLSSSGMDRFLDGGSFSNNYGIPGDWLSSVTDSLNGYMGSNYNDYGIPRDWLSGVTDSSGGSGGSYNDWGIPDDWLGDVQGSFGGGSSGGGSVSGAASAGAGVGEAAVGSGGSSGGGSGAAPATGGGSGSGGGSASQMDISDPYGRSAVSRDFRSTGSAAAAGGNAAASQSGGLRYQSLAGVVTGGGTSAASAATSAASLVGGTAASTAASAAAAQGSSLGVPFGIAAASPFVALLGKAVKGQMDDD